MIPLSQGSVDCVSGQLRGARASKLSPRELQLLIYLADRPDRVVAREELLREVWGHAPGSRSRTLFATVNRLRKKIEQHADAPVHVVTVGSQGYLFRPLQSPTEAVAEARVWGPRLPLDDVVERPALQARVHAWFLGPDCAPLWLCGRAGVGKTRLALEIAHRPTLPREGETVVVDVRACNTRPEVRAAVAQTLRLPTSGDRVAERVLRVMARNGRALLVLDGVRHVDLVTDWQHPEVRVLALSREALLPQAIVVPSLTTEQGRQLLVARACALLPRWTPDADATRALEQISIHLDHLPLALELVAPALQIWPATTLLQRLRADQIPLHGALASGLAWAVSQLSASESQVLHALACFEDSMDAEATVAVALDERALARLLFHGLVQRVGRADWRFVVPRAVRELLPRDPDPAVLERHATHFATLGSASRTEQVIVHGGAVDYDRIRRDLAHLRAVAAGPFGDRSGLAARAAVLVLLFDGHALESHAVLDAVETRLADLPVELRVWLRRMRADTCSRLGQHDRCGRILEALRLYAQAESPEQVGSVLHTLAVHHEVQSPPGRAEALFEEALVAHRAFGDRFRVGLSLGELATLHLRQGMVARSVPLFKDALEELRAVSAPLSEAIYLGNLAVSLMDLERHAEAESTLQEALILCRRLGAQRFEVGNLSNLGLLQASMGALDRAVETYEQALQRMRDRGDEMEHAATLTVLGQLHLRRGDLATARAVLDRASAKLSELELPYNQILCDLSRAALCRAEGDLDRCSRRLDEASTQVSRSAHQEAWYWAERGLVAHARGEDQAAQSFLERARTLDEPCPDGRRALTELSRALSST